MSLYKPVGGNGDETFTFESILPSPTTDEDSEENDHRDIGFYRKVVDFLISEYFSQKAESRELKRKEIELKAERLRLRKESLKFKRDRFESWEKLMEDKGRHREIQSKLQVQLQMEKLEFRKEQFYLKKRNMLLREATSPLIRERSLG